MESIREVQPLPTLAPYIGGKRNLARRLVTLIDSIRHEAYAEPFVGMGGVFFKRVMVPKAEIINDWNRDVATLFRILQRHYVAFMEMMRFQLTTRSEFERLAATDPATLTDLERAARFLYLQRTCFGGKVSGRNFGVTIERPARFDITKRGPILESVHERLAGVTIECLPWAEFIARYDRPGTLFYIDPPYLGCESDYGKTMFQRSEFEALAGCLKGLQGRFILSLNNRPEVRRIFRGFSVQTVETTYTIARKGNGKRASELLITNCRRAPSAGTTARS